MNQVFECNHCGDISPSVFTLFLHIFCSHMHTDVGLMPSESAELLPHCFEYHKDYYTMMYQVIPSLPNSRKEN
jgi:hypothetical protein